MSDPSGPARFLEERRREGWIPGGAWLVAEDGRVLSEGAVGEAVTAPASIAARADTLYDLASLTKPLATALLAVRLQAAGRLRLEDRLERHVPRWRSEDERGGLRLLDLLTHRSGLPAWDPLYVHARDAPGRVARLLGVPLAHAPLMGTTYSDPGYILLGFALETAGGEALDRLFERHVLRGLDRPELLFRPGPELRPRIAATEEGNVRERLLAGPAGEGYNAWRTTMIWGDVHDHNAFTLGGVAGHAGLFGTARGVFDVARQFLPGASLLGDEERALFSHNFTAGLSQDRAVGFQLASTAGCSAGTAMGRRAFGHTGFTGTSVWIDPDARRVVILLTNRVHPRFQDRDMNALRRDFHAVAAAL